MPTNPMVNEAYLVARPDYIPEGQEHLYPHLGGVFHDYVPEGCDAVTLQGFTDDATVTEEQREEARENKGKPRRGKKSG